ncbi:MAG: HAMP domain-containing histidine kinase [Sulfurovum sp.]|nr:HAMP domain-containing histidine kinase [Sulfurovum sp.]
MNELEKKSFYSFLGLYIISSFLFIGIIGYWYYVAQKNALENEAYYRLVHMADKISDNIIFAHMQQRTRSPLNLPDDIILALVNTKGKIVEGSLIDSAPLSEGYIWKNGYNILVSSAPREHLNIKYVVLQTDFLKHKMTTLRTTVVNVMIVVALFIALIAWVLSKIFIRPVHQRVKQIESFINDVTHELNTPISSLTMATDQALKQGECSKKILKNISISTRQLYDIYRSLTYLNFSTNKEHDEVIDLMEVLKCSIAYYKPLAEVKQISLKVETESTKYMIPKAQATLLFGNLISNAIKYSSRRSKIELSLKDQMFRIKDYGMGIDPKKQKEIFKKFTRATSYSGGFGVGLSIVKSICEQYHIDIELNSILDEGAEFRLYFS